MFAKVTNVSEDDTSLVGKNGNIHHLLEDKEKKCEISSYNFTMIAILTKPLR